MLLHNWEVGVNKVILVYNLYKQTLCSPGMSYKMVSSILWSSLLLSHMTVFCAQW